MKKTLRHKISPLRNNVTRFHTTHVTGGAYPPIDYRNTYRYRDGEHVGSYRNTENDSRVRGGGGGQRVFYTRALAKENRNNFL